MHACQRWVGREIKQTIETVGDVVRNDRVKLGYVLFVFLLYVPVNSYGHGGRSVHLTHFFLGKFEQAVNQIELGTPRSAVKCASVVRNVTDCAALPFKAKL